MPIGDMGPFDISGQFDPAFLSSINFQNVDPGMFNLPAGFGLTGMSGFNPGDPSTFGSLGTFGNFGGQSSNFGGMVLDTVTGNIVSAAEAQRIDRAAWEQFLGSQQATMSPNAPMLQPPGPPRDPGGFNLRSLLPRNAQGNIDWTTIIGTPAALLGAGGGLAGIVQALRGGGQTTETVNKFPPPTDQQLAIQRQGFQNLQGAGQFAFGGGTQTAGGGQIGAPGAAGGASGGLAGLYGGQQPFLNAAFLQALQQQAGQIQNNPFLGQGLQQFLGNQTQALGGQQAGLLGQAGQNALGFQPNAATPAILSQILGGLQNPLQPNPTAQNALNQVPGLPGQLTPPGVIGGLQGQAVGMQQGQLRGLSPELLQLINQTFAGGEAAIQGEADQALQGALEEARRQGFAGGLEQFGQGTPGALLAPGLQTATRERAMLEGQKAQSILGLMQGLPMEGGQLATTAGNLAQQNLGAQQGNIALGLQGGANLFGQSLQAAQLQQALQSLGLQGAQQQFGQRQGVNQNLLNTAQAFQNPFAMALQGGTNLAGLNQNAIQSLFGVNNAGLGLQNQFLSALGGQTGAAGTLSNAAQPLGNTQIQTQPFNLLSAMAPTANLLGGIGGVLTAMNPRPQINFQLPGGTTV